MKVLIQRVSSARCIIGGETYSEIGEGLLLFVSFHKDDDASAIEQLAKKTARLRIFEDEEGKMNRSALDLGREALSISQFTLEALTRKGNRPSFTEAMPPEKAEDYYHMFNEALARTGLDIKRGSFQSRMAIDAVNDGPVTVLLERSE